MRRDKGDVLVEPGYEGRHELCHPTLDSKRVVVCTIARSIATPNLFNKTRTLSGHARPQGIQNVGLVYQRSFAGAINIDNVVKVNVSVGIWANRPR